MPLVADEGICIVDNLDFHGMIFDIDNIKNRNTKQLGKKNKSVLKIGSLITNFMMLNIIMLVMVFV